MSQARESMSRVWVPIRVMVLVVALGGGWVLPNCARADDELQKARGEAGRVFGPDPGRTHHTAVWQKVRSDHKLEGPSGEAVARGIAASIADYVISVQTK